MTQRRGAASMATGQDAEQTQGRAGRPVARRAGQQHPPASVAFLFDRPPLIPGESEREWRGLLAGLAEAIQPGSILDWLRLRDVVNGIWEAMRLERFRDTLITLQRDQAAAELFEGLLRAEIKDPEARRATAESLARGWIGGRAAERREGERLLDRAGLRGEAVEAAAFLGQMETHERLDRLRRRAEAARDAGLPSRAVALAPGVHDIVIEAEVVAPQRRLARRQGAVEAIVPNAAGDTPRGEASARPRRVKPVLTEEKPPEPQADLFAAPGGAAH